MSQPQVDGVAGLKKHDIKVSGIVFMLYCLVAAGAFGIEEMIPEAGPGMTIILLVAFPIVWAYPISNLVAECGSVLPSEGGVYVWVKEAFGEFWGFQAGWWGTVSTYITNGVYVALVAGYVHQMIPMSDIANQALKIGMILIFTIINLMGLKEVGKVSTVLSILIVLAFALVAIVGFLNWNSNPIEPVLPPEYTVVDGIGGGICICVWMYCGYECISNMAGEVKNPQVIPKGLMIAMPLVALTYVLPTLAGLATLPAGSWENWSTDGGFTGETVGYATVLTQNLGTAWGYVFLVIAIISQCAIFNTYLASGSRGFFVLADDNLCPQFLVKVSRKRGVPYVGILSLAIVTLILAQSDFTTLVSAEVVFMLALYIILPLAVIKLRKKIPIEERKAKGLYVMPGGKLGLVFYAGFPMAIALIALLVNGTDYLVMGLIATSTGPIAYIIFKKLYGGMAKNDPINYPLNKKTKLAFGDTIRIGVFLIVAGALSFFGQFWLHWYEIDYGEWGPDDYDMMGNIIPQVLEILKWAGLAAIIIGLILAVFGRKNLEKDENKMIAKDDQDVS
ncbi:APC family permease [Ihubacter massiliensis]|uniref:APC family permease n=1 Tax=Hominibacterium faecale TaxID=2839743 RepID=A0A9J6QPZ8_9FIRM|nr:MULTISPECIES: APC family permease [Eubacteriales Family XIII. Incertae Sedis]MCO7121158.1 APC family permease [Ihubacter massiliensis]MCU7378074.1 APC family permease [Hominibacterium faecale]